MALSIGFGKSVSLLPAIQATRLLTFASVGLSPTEHTCFSWSRFRTAGFPQYGWKAGISDSAFPVRPSLKPSPGIRRCTPGLLLPFAHLIVSFGCPVLCRADDSSMRRLGGGADSAPGALAPVRVLLSRSINTYQPIRPTRWHIAISPTLRLIRDAFAVRERLGDLRVVPSFCCAFLLDMPPSMPSGRSKSVSSRSPISTLAFA
jgi:hypothetical protein